MALNTYISSEIKRKMKKWSWRHLAKFEELLYYFFFILIMNT